MEHIYYFILFYIRRAILTQTNPKKGLIEKKTHQISSSELKTHLGCLQEALDKFGNRRTDWNKGKSFQGVQTPTQARFVTYYDIITNKLSGIIPTVRTLRLKRVTVHSIGGVGNGDGSDLTMSITLLSTMREMCKVSNNCLAYTVND